MKEEEFAGKLIHNAQKNYKMLQKLNDAEK